MAASESERRIRAVVRAPLSAGVWLILALQIIPLVVLRPAGLAAGISVTVRTMAVALCVASLLYLTAGVSQALAHTREPVGIRQALRAGVPVYGPFLWLMVKTALAGALLLNAALLLMRALFAVDVAAWVEQSARLYPVIAPPLALVFVYWLPVVFVQGDYRLLATLRAGLAAARRHLAQFGFLAVLVLAPVVGFLALGASPPLAGLIALEVGGGLLGWMAYIYCAERLQAEADAARSVP